MEKRECERDITDSQFGFIHELCFSRIQIQNQREDVCLRFLDYEKAFDHAEYHKLMQLQFSHLIVFPTETCEKF